jgi:hypothetical protein
MSALTPMGEHLRLLGVIILAIGSVIFWKARRLSLSRGSRNVGLPCDGLLLIARFEWLCTSGVSAESVGLWAE